MTTPISLKKTRKRSMLKAEFKKLGCAPEFLEYVEYEIYCHLGSPGDQKKRELAAQKRFDILAKKSDLYLKALKDFLGNDEWGPREDHWGRYDKCAEKVLGVLEFEKAMMDIPQKGRRVEDQRVARITALSAYMRYRTKRPQWKFLASWNYLMETGKDSDSIEEVAFSPRQLEAWWERQKIKGFPILDRSTYYSLKRRAMNFAVEYHFDWCRKEGRSYPVVEQRKHVAAIRKSLLKS